MVPFLRDSDRDVLAMLGRSGPRRTIDPVLCERLFLWQLIRRTPAGWRLTRAGRTALALTRPPEAALPVVPPATAPRLPRATLGH